MSRKAIFFDRDGVLISNAEHYYIWEQKQVEFIDGIFDHLKKLANQGFLLFIVSNQGGISKGIYSKSDILKLHESLIQTFRRNEIEIQEIAFCPHHPEIENCLCRKPGSIMIDRLIAKYRINREESYFIGDSDSDMEAAKLAGVQGIKISPNQNMFPSISFLIKNE
jgi:D-glycero-D-manno-heptose 1,7-bisphosphate phosphatase